VSVPGFTFITFALIAAILFNATRNLTIRQGILLIANVTLLASFANHWTQLVPYAGFLALGAVGAELRRRKVRFGAWILPALVLLVFVWLKRYLFIPKAIQLHPGYLLVGLSYVFFRVLHLVIDGWEELPSGPKGFLSYVNYALNFTSLVSGPIQMYSDYKEQESRGTRPTRSQFFKAAERIVLGFFKVYAVSSFLYTIHHAVIADYAAASGWAKVLEGAAVVGVYPLYLYFNFSGYTDFVIGVGELFSFNLPENFNKPFTSGNFIDFWGRWHITLSSWLKSYVYSPSLIALMRRFPSRVVEPFLGVMSYFITFFLVGLWHGQTSEFVFFGFLQGGGVAANKLYQIMMGRWMGKKAYSALRKNTVYASFCRGLTFTWFAFTLLWFWSNWTGLEGFAHGMNAARLCAAMLALLLAAWVALEALAALKAFLGRVTLWGEILFESKYVRFAAVAEMLALIALLAIVLNAPPSQIVYQAF
jgi:D-alanyl-lipoteichoic acid acyltransferase DltB (MBOAT superfamily)